MSIQNSKLNQKNLKLYGINTTKNILFVVSALFSSGGSETRLYQYVTYLEKYGWNVYILSEKNSNFLLQAKKNFHLYFDADNFHDCLLEIVKRYNINIIEFQLVYPNILKKLNIENLKNYCKLGCTIHNMDVNIPLETINALDYSIIVSSYLYQNHYAVLKNAVVVQNGLDIREPNVSWKFKKQNMALLVSRIAPDKLDSIKCFIEYCLSRGYEFKIAGSGYLSDKLKLLLKQIYSLSDDVFIGDINTREYLKDNIDNILFVGGLGLVVLESSFLGIPSFCCSDWNDENYSFITKENISLFDNFTVFNSSPVSKQKKKMYTLDLSNPDFYDVQAYVFEKRNFHACFEKYLAILASSRMRTAIYFNE